MTTILLDTNAYLRLAKRIRPCLGVPFNKEKNYVLLVLPEVEEEVLRSRRLNSRYPWFADLEHLIERRSNTARLSKVDKAKIQSTVHFLLRYSAQNAASLMTGGRDPPGSADCQVLAVAQCKGWWVATDDEGMHDIGAMFKVTTLHCYEVLHKLMAAGVVDNAKVREIYDALENNRDLTAKWLAAKHTLFKKVFGARKDS